MSDGSRSSVPAILLWPALGGFASSAITSAVAFSVHRLLPPEISGSSAAGQLSNLSELAFAAMAVLLIPLFETFIGVMVPVEISRFLGAGNIACMIVVALAFALGHFLNGG